MPLWHRLAVVGAVLVVTAAVARLLDTRIARRDLDPVQKTRYRVLRRTVATAVVFVGLLSALLVIPQVRAVAGGLLASSAVIGLVIGFASQRTIGNFVAGLLIAFTQPLRLGDRVEVGGEGGVVEEIGPPYTFIPAADHTRPVIPNENSASASAAAGSSSGSSAGSRASSSCSRSAASAERLRSPPSATSRRSSRSRSARTRSSTPRTARSSARSPPSGTASPSGSRT